MLPDFLPPIDSERAREIGEKLGEVPERVMNNVKLLEEWMEYQTHLPQNYDRSILPSFLRGSKQNLAKAKKKLEAFFIAKDTQLDLYGDVNASYEGDLSCSKYLDVAILPELTPDGYRITVLRLTSSDTSGFEMHRILRYLSMLATMRAHHDAHQVAGEVIVLDVLKATPQHVSRFLCNLTRKCLELLQAATALKLKQIHVLTDMVLVLKAVAVVKQLFKEKMRDRFHVSGGSDHLAKHVPPKCLPEDYGGHLRTIREYSDRTYRYVSGCDLFDRLETMRINGEIPRDSTITLSNEDFGIDGSFRRLNLD